MRVGLCVYPERVSTPPFDPSAPPDPNPRAPRRRSSVELVRAVRRGRQYAAALRALSLNAHDPDADDFALANELARTLVQRCESHHEGWQALRGAIVEAGISVPWERAMRRAVSVTAQRILADCSARGRTPLVRVQHAAAEERARELASHLDQERVLAHLSVSTGFSIADWPNALAAAVRARSREQLTTLLREAALPAEPAAPTST